MPFPHDKSQCQGPYLVSTQRVQCLLVFNPLSTYTNKVSGLCIHCQLKKYMRHRSSQLSLFSGNHKDFKPRRQHLRWPWENCFWGGGLGKEPGYMEVCRKGQVTWVLKTRSLWKTRYLILRDLALSYVLEDASIELTEIISFICISVTWGQILLFDFSVQFSCSVMSNSLRPCGLQHDRPPCPSLTPETCSNSCSSSWWCHPTISYSVVPFSSHLQSFPASGSFQMSQFFASGGQSLGVSASISVLPMNIQD